MSTADPFFSSHYSQVLLKQWDEGLHHHSPEVQWQTFEQIRGLTDMGVMKLIERFLQNEQGDPHLKTKCLQQIKRICPWPISFQIQKYSQTMKVDIHSVPLTKEEWPAEARKPLDELHERAASEDPVLVQMAEELWLFFLERHYPFLPDFSPWKEWTGGLHVYALQLLYTDEGVWSAKVAEWAPRYQMSFEKLQEQGQRFVTWLL